MKFAFIHAEKAFFPVAALCRLLNVTRQGYYAFARRPPSSRVANDQVLGERLRALHIESQQTYGSPRMLRALHAEGMHVGKRRIERILRAEGLNIRPAPRFRAVTTVANPNHPVVANELNRDFTASRPNQRWVTDITYVWTAEGWCYLAAILDLYSRAIVGWALDTTLSTRLPLAALDMAIRRRHPGPGLLHHSDRGCQYTSIDYQNALTRLGIHISMSRKGNCWDNAVAESFFATLKNEKIHRKEWSTRLEVRAAIFEYIEMFYNRRRLHSTIGYKTPAQFEEEYLINNAA